MNFYQGLQASELWGEEDEFEIVVSILIIFVGGVGWSK